MLSSYAQHQITKAIENAVVEKGEEAVESTINSQIEKAQKLKNKETETLMLNLETLPAKTRLLNVNANSKENLVQVESTDTATLDKWLNNIKNASKETTVETVEVLKNNTSTTYTISFKRNDGGA